MRHLSRALTRTTAALACAVALATCADAPTGPSRPAGIPARLAIAPRFSAGATDAAAVLRQAGIEVASVRVVIKRVSNGDELFERTIAVQPGQASVTLEADVLLRSLEEELVALMEFFDAGGTVLYRGEQRVVARAGSNATVTVDAEIDFVGPGATAATVRLTPADTAISTTTPLTLDAAAIDAAGAPIASPILLWSSSDATLATVSATGIVTPVGPRGSVQVSARTPLGITGTATVRLLPPPVRVVVVGGGAQSGAAGSTLPQPFTVEVQAADGLPVPGQAVTFSAVTTGGSVTAATATTDAQGRASTPIKLGTSAGRYEFRAVSGSLGAVTIEATASPAAPSTLTILSGNAQSATVGSTLALPLVAKVRDAFGNLVTGATVAWQVTSGSGVLASTTAISDGSGHASVAYTVGNVPATESIKAALTGTSATVTFTATATVGAPARISIVSGDAQTAQEGTTLALPLVVTVADAFGNATPAAAVAWSVTSGNATLAQATSTTDAAATTSNTVTLGSPAGFPATATITATLLSGANVSFTATITPKPLVPAKLSITQQPPATARSGVVLGAPVRVQVTDSAGTPIAVAGQPVTAAIYSASPSRLPAEGSAAMAMEALSLTGTTSVPTDAAGVATFTDLAITGTEGPVTLSFTSGSLPVASSNAFTLTAGDVADIAMLPAPPTTPFVVTAGEPITENVWLETTDASGNRVPQVPVRFVARVGGPTGAIVGDSTLVSNSIGEIGAASFPTITASGTYHVTASIAAAGATPVMFIVQVNPSTAGATTSAVGTATIPINVGPVAIGSRSIVVRDAQGVGLPNLAVTFTLAGAGTNGSFTGDVFEVASTTDGSGVASFPAGVLWTPPAPEGSYLMTVVARDGATQVGGSLTFTAVRTQWTYRITAAPSTPAPSTNVALTAQLIDGNGASLPVSPVRNVTWSRAVGTGAAVSFATTSLASDGSTSASFTSDAGSGAVHTITVTDDNFAITGSATVTNAGSPAPTAILFGSTGPAASGDLQVAGVGDSLAQPLLVKVLDGNGSPMPDVAVEWRRRSNLSEPVVLDTTTTDATGVAAIRPVLPVEDTFLGHVFEASPVTATSLVLRFRAAARNGTEDAVWFGPAAGDGSSQLGYADWSVASHWSGGSIPSSSSNVLVPAWDNALVASPQLTGNVAVASITTGSDFQLAYLDLGTHELTVGGTLTGSLVAGTGTIRMTGTSGSVVVHAPTATLVVPAGANVSLNGFTWTRHVTVGGTLQVGEQSLQLEGGELLVSGQLLLGGGSIYGGANVVFDNTTFDSTNTGSITFGQLFEQRGTTELEMPEYFTVYANVAAAGQAATIRLANPSSSFGTLIAAGPDAGTSTLTIDGATEVSGDFVVNGNVNVTGTLLRLESDNVVLPVTADLSGLATLESRGYYAPMFAGAPPQMTEIWAAELNGPSQFNNLRVRESVQVYWHPFLVNGNLEVLGTSGALRMMSEQDTLIVKGSATFASDSASVLRRGVLRIGGDFSYIGTADFRPDTLSTGTKFVFEGASEQKVFFEPRLRGTVAYLGHLEVVPGSTVRQSTPLTIAGLATIGGTWIADSSLAVEGRVDVRGGTKPGRLETHAGSPNFKRLDLQPGAQWWNGASSSLGLNGANFFQGSQIWNYAGDAVYAEVCYNAGYEMMDNTQVYFSCSLEFPVGYVANLLPMPNSAPTPALAPRP